MFNVKQQTALQSGSAAIIVLMIGLIGGMSFGAALVWGALCGGVLLQLRRQNLLVAAGTDILHGTMHGLRSTAGVVHETARSKAASDQDGEIDDGAQPTTAPSAKRPHAIAEPRNGQADDLTRIDGIGPKLSAALNGIGIYHFDQIAQWNSEEVAWVDANLAGANGRASRENWVSQARNLKN